MNYKSPIFVLNSGRKCKIEHESSKVKRKIGMTKWCTCSTLKTKEAVKSVSFLKTRAETAYIVYDLKEGFKVFHKSGDQSECRVKNSNSNE